MIESIRHSIQLHRDPCTEIPVVVHEVRIVTSMAKHYAGGAAGGDAKLIIDRHHALQRMLASFPVVIPFAERLAELFPHDRVTVRRAFPQVMSLIQAITLLHQKQRQFDSDMRLIATQADYAYARQLLSKPISRSIGRAISDSALRFHDRLGDRVGSETFTAREAGKNDEGSRSSTYGWLLELVNSGAVEVVEEKSGPRPAKYRMTGAEPAPVDCLPSVADVFRD